MRIFVDGNIVLYDLGDETLSWNLLINEEHFIITVTVIKNNNAYYKGEVHQEMK